MCVSGCGVLPFLPGLPVGPVWPHWRPRVGSLPIIAGLRCRPGVHPCIAPRPVRYALRPKPGSLPQDHPESGVVALWLPPGQLHGNSSVRFWMCIFFKRRLVVLNMACIVWGPTDEEFDIQSPQACTFADCERTRTPQTRRVVRFLPTSARKHGGN